MSQKWEYNGVELEVDVEDADFVEKYEAAFNKLGEAEKKLQKVGAKSEIVRGYCDMFYGLFDDLYGAGTSERLFAGRKNTRLCDEAYGAFLDAVKDDVEESKKTRTAHVEKYYVARPSNNAGVYRNNKRYGQNPNRHQNQGQHGGRH